MNITPPPAGRGLSAPIFHQEVPELMNGFHQHNVPTSSITDPTVHRRPEDRASQPNLLNPLMSSSASSYGVSAASAPDFGRATVPLQQQNKLILMPAAPATRCASAPPFQDPNAVQELAGMMSKTVSYIGDSHHLLLAPLSPQRAAQRNLNSYPQYKPDTTLFLQNPFAVKPNSAVRVKPTATSTAPPRSPAPPISNTQSAPFIGGGAFKKIL